MNRNILAVAMTLLFGIGLLSACATTGGGEGVAGVPQKAEPGYKYVCACGLECNCGTSADKPGSCTCGKPMVYKRIVVDDKDRFGICPNPDCTSTTVKPNNPNICSCGTLVQFFPKEGKYLCACPGCDCNTTSNNPGKCVCGVPMKAR